METLLASWLPVNAAGEQGGHIDGLLSLVTYIITPWVILTFGLIILFCILYRRKAGESGLYLNSHDTLFHFAGIPIPKTAIIEIPTLCVLGLDLWIFASSVAVWGDIKIDRPDETAVEIQVIAKQFGWDFYYPGENGELDTKIERSIRRGVVGGKVMSKREVEVEEGDDVKLTGSALCIPRGEAVGLKIASLDVIHSLFIPHLRFKQDAVPGRNIDAWVRAEKLTRPKFREERVVEHLQSVISLLENTDGEEGKEGRATEVSSLEDICETLLQDRGVPPYASIREEIAKERSRILDLLSGGEDGSDRVDEAETALSSSREILDGVIKDRKKYGFYERQSYTIACAELCGYGHSGMTAQIVVLPKERFKTFLNDLYD